LGEGKYLIPLSIGAAAIGYLAPDDSGLGPVGRWGGNTARAYLVGAPSMLFMQMVTGGSRPDDTEGDSNWYPFNDNNGVSGHAFMGAVPFITLAKMNYDNPSKWLFYGASLLTAWSRLNDNDHYFSQSMLGWIMAYQSVSAVMKTNEQRQSQFSFNVFPYSDGGAGFMMSYQW
jgi:membrane-associated phospholipid phosphatase